MTLHRIQGHKTPYKFLLVDNRTVGLFDVWFTRSLQLLNLVPNSLECIKCTAQ